MRPPEEIEEDEYLPAAEVLWRHEGSLGYQPGAKD